MHTCPQLWPSHSCCVLDLSCHPGPDQTSQVGQQGSCCLRELKALSFTGFFRSAPLECIDKLPVVVVNIYLPWCYSCQYAPQTKPASLFEYGWGLLTQPTANLIKSQIHNTLIKIQMFFTETSRRKGVYRGQYLQGNQNPSSGTHTLCLAAHY